MLVRALVEHGMVINDESMLQKMKKPKDKMIKNMINIVICDLLPMERAREREREQKTSLPPFLSFLLRLFVAGYATNFKKYGVPLLLHESQLGQTVQTSSFWWTKNG